MMSGIGTALGQEAWAKGKYILEAPMLNMVRGPRGGRDWETFGEDPYLSAKMAASYCSGLQSVKCIAEPKHIICNDIEVNRQYYSSQIGERTLREIYAMPFEYAVREGKAWCVMSAYNQINGNYCSDYPHTLTDILKNRLGFQGVCLVRLEFHTLHRECRQCRAGCGDACSNLLRHRPPECRCTGAGFHGPPYGYG